MNEEDRKKYALAQAGQRAAGGAYMMSGRETGQVYELTEAEMNKNGWRDSVESVASYQTKPGHQRGNSYNSNDDDEKTSPEGGSPVDPVNNMLSVPQTSSTGQNRRSGRSPLARVSLIRTASYEGDDIELEEQRRQHSRSPSGRQI